MDDHLASTCTFERSTTMNVIGIVGFTNLAQRCGQHIYSTLSSGRKPDHLHLDQKRNRKVYIP